MRLDQFVYWYDNLTSLQVIRRMLRPGTTLLKLWLPIIKYSIKLTILALNDTS